LLATEARTARLKPTNIGDEVSLAYWSHRQKWEDIDDRGVRVLILEKALHCIAIESLF